MGTTSSSFHPNASLHHPSGAHGNHNTHTHTHTHTHTATNSTSTNSTTTTTTTTHNNTNDGTQTQNNPTSTSTPTPTLLSTSLPSPSTTIVTIQSLSDADKQSSERLLMHIARDIPHHILERKLTPNSGRFSYTYRIRHQDSGAVMVLKVLLLQGISDEMPDQGTTNTSVGKGKGVGTSAGNTTNTNTGGGGGEHNLVGSGGSSAGSGGGGNSDTGSSGGIDNKKKSLTTRRTRTKTRSNTNKNTNPNPAFLNLNAGMKELHRQERTLYHINSKIGSHANILPFVSWEAGSVSFHVTNVHASGRQPSSSSTVSTSARAGRTSKKSLENLTQKASNAQDKTNTSTTVPAPVPVPVPAPVPVPPVNIHIHKPIYLMRPHTYTTLSERIEMRPFLSNAEKMFIAHQIIRAVQYLHSRHLCHGHLNCENVGLSSWNWVGLMDIYPSDYDTSSLSKVNPSQGRSDNDNDHDEDYDYDYDEEDDNPMMVQIGRPVVMAQDDPSDWIYYFQERTVGVGNDGIGTGTGTNTGGTGIGTNTGTGGGDASNNNNVVNMMNNAGTTATTMMDNNNMNVISNATSSDGTSLMNLGGIGIGIGSSDHGHGHGGSVNNSMHNKEANIMSVNNMNVKTGRAGTGEKRCYLAPERFVVHDHNHDDDDDDDNDDLHDNDERASPSSSSSRMKLTPAMDIFSLGCVLMELFLNGEPAMDLGDLMEYKRSGGDIASHSSLPQKLKKIESGSMRAACRHMLHLDPRKRLTAGDYLKRLVGGNTSTSSSTNTSNDGVRGGKGKDKETGKGTRKGRDTSRTGGKQQIGKKSTSSPTASSSSSSQPPLPSCHETVLFPLFERIRFEVMSPDARIAIAAIQYGKVVRDTVGVDDVVGTQFFHDIVGPSMMKLYNMEHEEKDTEEEILSGNGKDAVSGAKEGVDDKSKSYSANAESSMEDIPICKPFPKDGFNCDQLLAETEKLLREIEMNCNPEEAAKVEDGNIPKQGETNATSAFGQQEDPYVFSAGAFHKAPQVTSSSSSAALVIFVQFVLSTIRHAQRPSSKLVGMQLLLRLSRFSSDEVRLQRIVPTIVSVLRDPDANVRSMAIKVLTAVLSITEHFPPSDAQIFPQYILKRVSHLINDPVLMVRISFAESIVILAETAMRFLDTCHAIKLFESVDGEAGYYMDDDTVRSAMESAGTAFQGGDAAKLLGSPDNMGRGGATCSRDKAAGVGVDKEEKMDEYNQANSPSLICNDFDKDLTELHEIVARWVVSITTDTADHVSALKQAILNDIARLCQFFGSEGVMSCILPQILAFLNDRKDWQLRAALCKNLPSVCAIVGRAATEQFVIPCVETALIDDEEMVVSSALLCLSSLVETGLLTRIVLLGVNPKNSSGTSTSKKTNESKPTAKDQSRKGILQKYSPLLVYPSDEVRYAASSLFATCSRTVGFPDDEVLVLPILRPFLRHDGSRSLLYTDGILSSLLPPLCKKYLRGIPLDISSRYFIQIRECHSSDEDQFHCFIDGVRSFLSMHRRGVQRDRNAENNGTLRVIHDKIESMLRLSCTVHVPNQKHAELITDPKPLWCEELKQRFLRGTSTETEISVLRSAHLLKEFYDLTNLSPPLSAQPERKWSETEQLMHDKGFNDEKLRILLSSPESRKFVGATIGEWGAIAMNDPALMEVSQLASKLASMKAPLAPPCMGSLSNTEGKRYSCHHTVRNAPPQQHVLDAIRRTEWKPKVDALTCSTSPHEHNGPVTRLALSQDQKFFVSASHDGTCKVFETQQILNSSGDLKSCLTIGDSNVGVAIRPRINDITIIENSHSVASGKSDGSVEVWRVDMVSKDVQAHSTAQINATSKPKVSRVSGYEMIRKVKPHEGEILSVSHFNTDSASIVTYASQQGIHTWDLRSDKEPFSLSMRPEMGYITSMAVGNDRNWIVAGTRRGYLALWDIRFQKLVKVWQHSNVAPVNRLGTSFAALSYDNSPKPYVVMGCGLNESAVFDISSGKCRHCFRVLDPSLSYVDKSSLPAQCTSLPKLNEIHLSSDLEKRVKGVHKTMESVIDTRLAPPQPCIQSFGGRVGSSGTNYLVTGGTDGYLRYWDFSDPSKCFTISGLRYSQPRPAYESLEAASGKIILCRQLPVTKPNEIASATLPKLNKRGVVRPENRHRDAIMDVKKLEYPMKGFISCSRNGLIKFWR